MKVIGDAANRLRWIGAPVGAALGGLYSYFFGCHTA